MRWKSARGTSMQSPSLSIYMLLEISEKRFLFYLQPSILTDDSELVSILQARQPGDWPLRIQISALEPTSRTWRTVFDRCLWQIPDTSSVTSIWNKATPAGGV